MQTQEREGREGGGHPESTGQDGGVAGAGDGGMDGGMDGWIGGATERPARPRDFPTNMAQRHRDPH